MIVDDIYFYILVYSNHYWPQRILLIISHGVKRGQSPSSPISLINWSPHIMTLKASSSLPLCSPKSHKHYNYGKAPYIVFSYPQFPQAKLLCKAIHLHSQQTNSQNFH